jgi:hypothetical protein
MTSSSELSTSSRREPSIEEWRLRSDHRTGAAIVRNGCWATATDRPPAALPSSESVYRPGGRSEASRATSSASRVRRRDVVLLEDVRALLGSHGDAVAVVPEGQLPLDPQGDRLTGGGKHHARKVAPAGGHEREDRDLPGRLRRAGRTHLGWLAGALQLGARPGQLRLGPGEGCPGREPAPARASAIACAPDQTATATAAAAATAQTSRVPHRGPGRRRGGAGATAGWRRSSSWNPACIRSADSTRSRHSGHPIRWDSNSTRCSAGSRPVAYSSGQLVLVHATGVHLTLKCRPP